MVKTSNIGNKETFFSRSTHFLSMGLLMSGFHNETLTECTWSKNEIQLHYFKLFGALY